jgi:hypothetical protein
MYITIKVNPSGSQISIFSNILNKKRKMHSFIYIPDKINSNYYLVSSGVKNTFNNYDILHKNIMNCSYNLILKLPLIEKIKNIFLKYNKKSVNVKLSTKLSSTICNATLTFDTNKACLEVCGKNKSNNDIFYILSEEKNVNVIFENRDCNQLLFCFQIYIIDTFYDDNPKYFYGICMDYCNYSYKFITYSLLPNKKWYQLGQDIDGKKPDEYSGGNVSLSNDGKIVAIGAGGSNGNSGTVRIYQRNGLIWQQLGSDINGNNISVQTNGIKTSLSDDGKIVAVSDIYNIAGRVRIYQYDDSKWNQLGGDIYGIDIGDKFGSDINLSSNGLILAIGATNNNNINGINAGLVSVYEYDNTTWNQLGSDIYGESDGELSGYSVSLSSNGKIVAIGARNNNGSGNNSGRVHIHKYDGMNWIQLGHDIDGESMGDLSGTSVSLSSNGEIVAIGAELNNGNGVQSGHVRVYKYNDICWHQLGDDIDGEIKGDYSGVSVSLSDDGDILAIGARGNDGNGNDSGHVRVYKYDGIQWVKLDNDIDGENVDDQSGISVSLSGNGKTLAIGGALNDGNGNNAGHVRVYTYDIPLI